MGAICIRAGLLVDGTDAPPLRDGAMLVRDNRIEAVGPYGVVRAPEGAELLEYPSLTLLPGLVDCHTHLNLPGDGSPIEKILEETDDLLLLRSAENARIALESGVTSLRENGARNRTAFIVKEAVARGVIRGPRLSICGRPVTTTRGHCWMFGGEADGEGVIRTVRGLIEEGADWIKVMATGGGTLNTDPLRASYSTEEMRAAVEEAHAAGRLAAAHALCTAGIVNALDAGFDMIVHCQFYDEDGRLVFRPDIARRIADQGVWVNPTMHVARSRIWSLEQLAAWRPLTREEASELGKQRLIYEERCRNLQGLLAAGVRMAAGSDSGWSRYPFGGFAYEVDAMVEGGMEPAAFRAATLESARAMGIDREVGSLEAGKLADFLLVAGDPTRDSRVLLQPVGVFLDGKRVD